MNITQLLGRLGSDNPPTNEELAQAEKDIKDALNIATTSQTPDLELARSLRESLDKVREELTTREAAQEQARQEAARLREGIFDEETPGEEEEEEEETPPADEAPKEPVAASVNTDDLIARLKAHTAKLPAVVPEKPKTPAVVLKPVGPAAGFDLNSEADFSELGQMFSTHAKSITRDGSSVPLARLTKHFEDERTLGQNVDMNNRKLAQVFGFGSRSRPVAAAGGLCGPGEVDFSHPICSDRGRPIRDALVQFNASRGRLQFFPATSFGDLSPAVSIWTSDTDSAPGTATKPCPDVLCEDEVTASVDAVVRCITVGNFQAQFSPEFWASRLELLLVAHDQKAEQKMISEIHDASTNLTDVAPAAGDAMANFVQTVNTVIAADRMMHRNLSGEYVVIADAFVRDAIRNQFIENNGQGNVLQAIQVADAEIAGWLSTVNARAVWTYDGTIDTETGDHRVATAGTLPTESTLYIYPVEAFVFLDGGTLDLGTSITDSSLNATNDRQAFAETFEKVAFRGCSSYRVEIALPVRCGC